MKDFLLKNEKVVAEWKSLKATNKRLIKDSLLEFQEAPYDSITSIYVGRKLNLKFVAYGALIAVTSAVVYLFLSDLISQFVDAVVLLYIMIFGLIILGAGLYGNVSTKFYGNGFVIEERGKSEDFLRLLMRQKYEKRHK